MKKILSLLSIISVLISCHRDELAVPYGNVNIQIAFENGYLNFPKSGIEVQILEQDGTAVATTTTNANGEALFANILNDVYQIKVAHTFQASTVFPLLGIRKELRFVGETKSFLVNAHQTNTQTLVLKTNQAGGFVIKEVYNSNAGGGTFASGFYQYVRFNDGFFEIYNNSPQTLYADGLQIGIVTNQYETTWKQDTEHAYVAQVFKINGTGKEHPVLPGKSLVIAATAINHKSASGLSQNQINNLYLFGTVNKSVDLSNAHFETYFDGFATNYDIDVASVPNLDVEFNTYATVKEIVTTNRGIGLVLMQQQDLSTFETIIVERGNTTRRNYQYKKIPITAITDAFEAQTQQYFPTKITGEYLPVLQAWEGKSYRRKISTTVGGRNILQDTDNCVADFEELSSATPGGF